MPPFRRVIELRPNSPEAHLNLGAALIQTGSLEEGLASFRRAVDLGPTVRKRTTASARR